MEVRKFNKLLKNCGKDKNAKHELMIYCLQIFKQHLKVKVKRQYVEDLSHDILIHFMENIPGKLIKTAPAAYLHRTVNNYLSNLKKRSVPELELSEEIFYEQNFVEPDDYVYGEIKKLVGDLNAQILYYHIVLEYQEKEIAQELNMDYNVVRKRISRSIKKLKETLSEDVTKYL